MPHRNFMMKNGLLRSWGGKKIVSSFFQKKGNLVSFVPYHGVQDLHILEEKVKEKSQN